MRKENVLFSYAFLFRSGDSWSWRHSETHLAPVLRYLLCGSRLNGCGCWHFHPALFQHSAQAVRIVGGDPVDAHINKGFHAYFLVDRPYLDDEAESMGLFELGGIHLAVMRRPDAPSRRLD